MTRNKVHQQDPRTQRVNQRQQGTLSSHIMQEWIMLLWMKMLP